MTEISHVSLKMSWKNHSRKSHFPSQFSHSMKAIILTILYPFAAAHCSLQSLSADRLMQTSVNGSPSVKFKNHLCPPYSLTLRFINLFKDAFIPNFHRMPQHGPQVIGLQKFEENFSRHPYDNSFIIWKVGFGVTRHSFRNSRRWKSLGILYLLWSGKIKEISGLVYYWNLKANLQVSESSKFSQEQETETEKDKQKDPTYTYC
jgi:hypothetical protein